MDPSIWYPALSILTLIAMGGQYAISGLAYEGPHKGNVVFHHTESEQLAKYTTVVSPYHWAHRIWFFIYAWQGLWIIYAILFLCRHGRDGPQYAKPVLLPPSLFILTICHFGCHIAWQLLVDRDHILASLIVLAVNLVLLVASLGVSYNALSKTEVVLRVLKRDYDIWLVRLLLHNSLGLQIGWATVITFLYIAKFMMYEAEPEVNSEIAGTAVIGAILGLVVIYSIVDLLILGRVSRYTITTNVAVVYAMAVILDRNLDGDERNFILIIVTLVTASAFLFMKIAVIVYVTRKQSQPMKETNRHNGHHVQHQQEDTTHYEVMDYRGRLYLLY